MLENEFWKVCEVIECEQRMQLLCILLTGEKTDFPCVSELAERLLLSNATVSVHLRKLASVGLVVSERSERRVYYRAFATTEDAARVIEVLRRFFARRPSSDRIRRVCDYAHALSHLRRNAIVRCLHLKANLPLLELSRLTNMPPKTAERLWGELNKAHIVDLDGNVVVPADNPEATLLKLTLV